MNEGMDVPLNILKDVALLLGRTILVYDMK